MKPRPQAATGPSCTSPRKARSYFLMGSAPGFKLRLVGGDVVSEGLELCDEARSSTFEAIR
jgi:hypothetical protein